MVGGVDASAFSEHCLWYDERDVGKFALAPDVVVHFGPVVPYVGWEQLQFGVGP